MKTKTLVLTALLALGGGAAVQAQSVYSLNVVGYVNANVVSGFNILCNPFNVGSNHISQVLPTVEVGTFIYTLKSNGTYTADLYAGEWLDAEQETPSTTTLSPGQGFFLYAPSARSYTFVGEVKTGNTDIPLWSGFNLIASAVPQSYQLVSPDFPAATGMAHYKLNTNGTYTSSIYAGQWLDAETEEPVQVYSAPADALASGFFLYNPNAQTTWSRSFTF